MQLTYRGQTYSYPYTEAVQIAQIQPLCVYRGVRTGNSPIPAKTTVPRVTFMCYRGISYLQTLTPEFN